MRTGTAEAPLSFAIVHDRIGTRVRVFCEPA